MGYNPSEPHLNWLESVYPTLADGDRPLECVQGPGDIVYVPSGWIHATVNIGDTTAIAQRVSSFPAESTWFKGNLSSLTIVEATKLRDPEMALAGLALAREVVALDPTEGDHHQNLAHALRKWHVATPSFFYHALTVRFVSRSRPFSADRDLRLPQISPS